jgi:hypothetical protein
MIAREELYHHCSFFTEQKIGQSRAMHSHNKICVSEMRDLLIVIV